MLASIVFCIIAVFIAFICSVILYFHLNTQSEFGELSEFSLAHEAGRHQFNNATGITFKATEKRLHLERKGEELELPLLEPDQHLINLKAAENANVVYALINYIKIGRTKLLKIVFPPEDKPLDQCEIVVLIDSDNMKVSLIELYDEKILGTADDKTLEDLKTLSMSRFHICEVYEVSDDGNNLLILRNDIELLDIKPVATYCNRTPYFYNVAKNEFRKICPN